MNAAHDTPHESGFFCTVYLPVRLVGVSGALQGHVFENWGPQLLFGRAFSNDVVLPDDATSKVHARITCEDGIFYLEDLNSENGTHLQGRSVQRERLQSGHIIRIGLSSFRFETVTPEPATGRRTGMLITIGLVLSGLVLAAVWALW